jgi:2-keto-4-pentenoate hydratase/2-oxohepta-3-ene-1,7-dioic acid hydratase in catechol pathway
MKLGNIGGRAVLVQGEGLVDIAQASEGAFGPDLQDLYASWDAFVTWAENSLASEARPAAAGSFDAVSPRPSQVLAVGLNYRAHALESGLAIPEVPLVFTKFPSSVAGPEGQVELPTDQVDWEVEVAVVIGREASRVSSDDAWQHVAGITAAQDFSARDVQMAGGSAPQFSLGKSFAGFTPLGPVLVTVDELDDPDAIGLECRINGELVQSSSTADLIFSVPTLVSYLSHVVTLQPGDVILTGTPSGVGLGMKPPRYLQPGDTVTTTVQQVGEMRHECVRDAAPFDPVALLAR